MNKIIWLISLVSLLAVVFSCKSYQGEDDMIQRQEEQEVAPLPVYSPAPERGGNAGNR